MAPSTAGALSPEAEVRVWASETLAAWKRDAAPPMWQLGVELKVEESLLRPLVATIPELWLGTKLLGKTTKEFVDLWHLTDAMRVAELQGVLTCHALSPM